MLDAQTRAWLRRSGSAGELFPAIAQADLESGALFLDFFQHDRDGEKKEIVQIDLEDLA